MYIKRPVSQNEKSSFFSIKNLVGVLGFLLLIVYGGIDNHDLSPAFLGLGFTLMSVSFFLEIFDELKTGVAKINYGTKKVYYRTDPIFYWVSILVQLAICICGLWLAYMAYTLPECV